MTCSKKPPAVAAKLGVDTCVLEDDHHGPVHEDADGRTWQDSSLVDPEVAEHTT